MKTLAFVAFAATLSIATATATASAAAAGRVSIVSEHDLAKSWNLSPETARFVAGYPAVVTDKSQDVCVNLGFMIKDDGSTSDYILMKSWSSASQDPAVLEKTSEPFVKNAAAAVSRWKFTPADKPHPVYTSVSMVFRGSQGDADSVRAHCRIDDLEAFVANAKGAHHRDAQQLQKKDMQALSRY